MPLGVIGVRAAWNTWEVIAQEHPDRGQPLPKDTTEIVHAYRDSARVPAGGRSARPVRRRQTGSHERWTHADGRSVTIPLHGGRDIGAPLFFKMLRHLNVSSEGFDKLR